MNPTQRDSNVPNSDLNSHGYPGEFFSRQLSVPFEICPPHAEVTQLSDHQKSETSAFVAQPIGSTEARIQVIGHSTDKVLPLLTSGQISRINLFGYSFYIRQIPRNKQSQCKLSLSNAFSGSLKLHPFIETSHSQRWCVRVCVRETVQNVPKLAKIGINLVKSISANPNNIN